MLYLNTFGKQLFKKEEKMRKAGFTLVEILVVIVVIGMIMAFLIPSAMQSIRTANVRACDANFRAIDSAIQMCMSERRDGTTAGCGTQANVQVYMPNNVWPTCPVNASLTGYAITPGATAATMPNTIASRAVHFAATGVHN
jgi:prepilin-type N-terminal cleavage/methylation domain-containing protein